MFFLRAVFLLLISLSLFSLEENLIKLNLPNGIAVILKKTDFDKGEFFVQMMAKGGLQGLKQEERAAASMAFETVWSTGFGPYSGDSLSGWMYRDSVELSSRIERYSRIIEGSSGKEGAETLFKIIHFLFTDPQFSKEELQKVISQNKEAKSLRRFDLELSFEDFAEKLNRDVKLEPAQKIEIEDVKNLYEKSMQNPSEWKMTVVGDFEIGQIENLLKKYIGTLPKKSMQLWPDYKKENKDLFPKGIVLKKISMPKKTNDALTRMTFPLNYTFSAENYLLLIGITQLIERQLRDELKEKLHKTHGLDVSFELPFYPYHDSIRLLIQFRSNVKDSEKIEAIILKELADLREKGPDLTTLEKVKKDQQNSEELWRKQNSTWQSLLINALLWDINPEFLINQDPFLEKKPIEIRDVIKDSIHLDNYTILKAVS